MTRRLVTLALVVALLAPLVVADARPLFYAQRQKWLGQPATAAGVVPANAGFVMPANAAVFCDQLRGTNRSGSAVASGVVGLLRDTAWHFGQWTNASTTYTADTTDAQDSDTNDVALETTTQNDGFIVGATVPFGVISLDVTTAGSGTTPTHVAEYWDGVAWTAIATAGLMIDVARSTDWPLGESVVLFDAPLDWQIGGSGTGVPATYYNLRVRRTNVTQATAALARRVYVGVGIATTESLSAQAGVGFGPAAYEHSSNAAGTIFDGALISALGIVFATADEGNNFSYSCFRQ